jgi:hypothetical protein
MPVRRAIKGEGTSGTDEHAGVVSTERSVPMTAFLGDSRSGLDKVRVPMWFACLLSAATALTVAVSFFGTAAVTRPSILVWPLFGFAPVLLRATSYRSRELTVRGDARVMPRAVFVSLFSLAMLLFLLVSRSPARAFAMAFLLTSVAFMCYLMIVNEKIREGATQQETDTVEEQSGSA